VDGLLPRLASFSISTWDLTLSSALVFFFGWDHPLLLLPAACGIFQDRRDVEKWGWGTCQVHHGDLIGTVFSFLFFSTLTGSDVPRH